MKPKPRRVLPAKLNRNHAIEPGQIRLRGVAQSCTLLYRRIAFGRVPKATGPSCLPARSGLQIRDTAECNSALRPLRLRRAASLRLSLGSISTAWTRLLATLFALLLTPLAGAAGQAEAVVTKDTAVSPPVIWYRQPTTNWNEALPIGNGRLGAMVFGGIARERLQLNEESLWAGSPMDAYPPDYSNHLAHVQQLMFAGKNAEAHDYGVKHLTATPTAFRSYHDLSQHTNLAASQPERLKAMRERFAVLTAGQKRVRESSAE